MKNCILIPFSAALILSASCGKQGPDYPSLATPLTKAEEAVNASANSFGFDVYHSLYKEDQLLFSPLSASLALSMTAAGADGNTAKQMTKVLGFNDFTTDDVNGYYQKMVATLLTVDPDTIFEIANSIWISDRISVRKGFIDDARTYYSSEVFPADFASQATVDKVNKWCSDKTHGKINSILDKPDPRMVMALMNALYFKGSWTHSFQDVREGKFNSISGSAVKMDMMHLTDELYYAEYDGFSMAELPYGNGAFSMKVILPGVKEDFAKAVKRFSAKTLDKLNEKATKENVSVTMPKFTFEDNSDLNDVLIALGMEDAFNADKADFSKMSDGLYIGFVKQKTFIDVNESGTEAAAVTIVGMEKNAIGGGTPKVINFIADRPFLFIIQENSTGAVLFIGQKVS